MLRSEMSVEWSFFPVSGVPGNQNCIALSLREKAWSRIAFSSKGEGVSQHRELSHDSIDADRDLAEKNKSTDQICNMDRRESPFDPRCRDHRVITHDLAVRTPPGHSHLSIGAVVVVGARRSTSSPWLHPTRVIVHITGGGNTRDQTSPICTALC